MGLLNNIFEFFKYIEHTFYIISVTPWYMQLIGFFATIGIIWGFLKGAQKAIKSTLDFLKKITVAESKYLDTSFSKDISDHVKYYIKPRAIKDLIYIEKTPNLQPTSKEVSEDSEPKKKKNVNNIYDLFLSKYLKNWKLDVTDNKNKFILILGSSGIGKTTLLEKIFYDFYYIQLNHYIFSSDRILLYTISEDNLKKVDKLLEKDAEKTILLLDGLDESYSLKDDKPQMGLNYMRELFIRYRSCKSVVISCRSQFIQNEIYTEISKPENKNQKISVTINNQNVYIDYYSLYLFEDMEKEIKPYIYKRYSWFQKEKRKKAIHLINTHINSKLFQRPFVLSYIDNLIEDRYKANKNELENMFQLEDEGIKKEILESLKDLKIEIKTKDKFEKLLADLIEKANRDIRQKIKDKKDEIIQRSIHQEKFENSSQLYRKIVEIWFERETKKNKVNDSDAEIFKENMKKCSLKVAHRMWEHKTEYLSKNDFENDIIEFGLTNFSVIENKSLLFPCIVKKESSENKTDSSLKYKFAHRSLMEYFIALESIEDPIFGDTVFWSDYVNFVEDANEFYYELCEEENKRHLDSNDPYPDLRNDILNIKQFTIPIVIGFKESKKLILQTKSEEILIEAENGKGLVDKLREIKRLDFGEYHLEDSIAQKIGHFWNLEELNLSKNSITKLDFIKYLKNLKSIDLSSNEIVDITPLIQLPSYTKIKIDNNPISFDSLISLNEKRPNENFINTILYDGNTHLHKSVLLSNIEKVKILLQKGANLDSLNINGCTSFRCAYYTQNHEIREIFYKKGYQWKILIVTDSVKSKIDSSNKKSRTKIKNQYEITYANSKNWKKKTIDCKPDFIILMNVPKEYEKSEFKLRLDLSKIFHDFLNTKNVTPPIGVILNTNSIRIDDLFELNTNELLKKYKFLTYTNHVGMEFVYIPEGEFLMGASGGEEEIKQVIEDYKENSSDISDLVIESFQSELPQHKVKIEKHFYMSKYEVRISDFKKFVQEMEYKAEAEMGGGAYGYTNGKWDLNKDMNWKNPGFNIEQDNDHPVVCMSWNDAKGFCKWLNEKQATSRDVAFGKYRLPTEAEWEYAARSGTTTKYFWGDEKPEANVADESFKKVFKNYAYWKDYDDGYVYTSPVGSFQPNDFGLYDMLGNVWEWCEDWYDEKFYEKTVAQASLLEENKEKSKEEIIVLNPFNNTDDKCKVLRGGSWSGVPRNLRVSDRNFSQPVDRFDYLGFRVVLPLSGSL